MCFYRAIRVCDNRERTPQTLRARELLNIELCKQTEFWTSFWDNHQYRQYEYLRNKCGIALWSKVLVVAINNLPNNAREKHNLSVETMRGGVIVFNKKHKFQIKSRSLQLTDLLVSSFSFLGISSILIALITIGFTMMNKVNNKKKHQKTVDPLSFPPHTRSCLTKSYF